MTVSYTAEVATCRGLGCFLKLLARWRGSIYKLVWLDLLLFLSIYYTLNLTYRLVLNQHQKQIFESVVKYCGEYIQLIPLSFILGFYVSLVMTRWWNQYVSIPFPDPIAVFVSTTVHGQDERGRVMRRTIMRYVCLSVTMMFSMISPRVKKRFPTLDHFVEAGLLQQSEKCIISDLNIKFPKYSKYWLPLVWASSIITRARKEGRIRDDFAVKTVIDELNKFRGKCGLLLHYDNISIPLVYTQVVTLAVYSYFLATLVGQQWIDDKDSKVDLYFPVFTTLQFFFYMGWLKVAETLINPFGDDDDDFEVNWMIDRNLQVSYLIVDEMHHDHPELVRDQYWDEVFPQELPYTLAAEPFRGQHPQPSTANIAVQPDEPFTPSCVKLDYMDDMNSTINFTAKPGSYNSQVSAGTTVPDSMSRVNSVTSLLKRFFSREDSRTDSNHPVSRSNSRRGSTQDLPQSATAPLHKPPGSLRIVAQTIEEVDEQATINSQRGSDVRPSVMGLFGPPPASAPVPVPQNNGTHSATESSSSQFISTSAPTKTEARDSVEIDNISIGASSTASSDDEFARLKHYREKERRSRLMLNLTRSLSSNTSETELLMTERRPSKIVVTPQPSAFEEQL